MYVLWFCSWGCSGLKDFSLGCRITNGEPAKTSSQLSTPDSEKSRSQQAEEVTQTVIRAPNPSHNPLPWERKRNNLWVNPLNIVLINRGMFNRQQNKGRFNQESTCMVACHLLVHTLFTSTFDSHSSANHKYLPPPFPDSFLFNSQDSRFPPLCFGDSTVLPSSHGRVSQDFDAFF